MDTAARNVPCLDADEFLRTDQREFGSAWRYEPDGVLALPGVGITVPLAALYDRVLPASE
jgi:hypothetical protein